MKTITILLTVLIQSFNLVSAQTQTVFGLETAVDNGNTITETMDDIMMTISGPDDSDLRILTENPTGFGGTTDNVVITSSVTSVTFTFDQPVVIHSIIAIEANAGNVDYTFTPTGGSNSPVTVSLTLGVAPKINLNWVNVTSFTVTASVPVAFGFDDVSVDTGTNGQTFFEWETAINSGGTITEIVNGIGVEVAGDASYTLTDYGGISGTSDNVVLSNANRTSITFTFDQPVVVNSILALEGSGTDIDYTFTPTGGNNNSVVVASLVSGATAVPLNWIGVTSFTVTASGAEFGFDNLSVMGIQSLTLFDWESAAEYVDGAGRQYVEETIDGVTTTVITTGNGVDDNIPHAVDLISGVDLGYGGATGNFVFRGSQNNEPMIVTFNKPVVVNSILPLDHLAHNLNYDVDYTFTPTGGNNQAVTVILIKGEAPTVTANLNWVNVTSFTITVSGITSTPFSGVLQPIIDSLSVHALITLGVSDNQNVSKVRVYPNPVENTLHIKNISDLKTIRLYNLLGQEVLQNNANIIDVSALSQGMYILQIYTSKGMETKRIIKE